MGLKKYHRKSPHYRQVASKRSIQDWSKAISILCYWKVLDKQVAKNFQDLLDLRNPAVHFGKVGDRTSRAQSSVRLIYSITNLLFGQSIARFFWVTGEIYVKQCYESDPFTKEFILPHCHKVGYRHTIEMRDGRSIMVDQGPYQAKQITDEEFIEFRKALRQ